MNIATRRLRPWRCAGSPAQAGLASGLFVLLLGGAVAQTDANAPALQARRQVLEQQRAAVEAQHAAAIAQCEQRFAINACLAEADQARRSALAPLRQESLALDDAERQSRAMARAHQAAQRQQQVAQRALPAASAGPSQVAAPAPIQALEAPAAPEPLAAPTTRGGPTAEATALALRRAAAAEKRRAQAAADRERIAAKQAERARSSASSPGGLPVPQSAFKP
jgi:hypothetical protein